MKDPQLGSNKIQSFIDYETTQGKIRFGSEGLQLFGEVNGQKVYLTDSSGNIIAPLAEASSGAGVPIDGSLLKDGTLTRVTPLLTTGFPTVSIAEYGDGRNFVDVITLTNFIVGTIPAAAAALATGALLASFPAAPGFHIEDAYYQELQLQLPGTPVNADVGLGSLVGSGAQALLSSVGATAEDRMTGQTIATAAVYGSAVKSMFKMALTGISVNLNNSIKGIFLNAAGTWNVNNAGSLLAQGIVVVKWTKMV